MKKYVLFILVSLSTLLSNSVLATSYNYGIAKTTDHSRPYPGTSLHNVITQNNGCYIGENNKNIYLSFDCGYENGYTGLILDALKETDTKAIFFITGHYLTSSTDLVKRMVDDGHIIGNHSDKHLNFAKNSNEDILTDINKLEAKYESLIGDKLSNYIRPPEGSISETSAQMLSSNGYKTIFWSLAYVDWYKDKYYGSNYSYKIVLERIHNGAIILMHTVSKDNAMDLRNIIVDLKEQGYRFGQINEII